MNRIAAKITGNIANFAVPVIEHGTAVSRIFGQNTVVVETAFDIADCSLIIINGTAFYSVNGVPGNLVTGKIAGYAFHAAAVKHDSAV